MASDELKLLKDQNLDVWRLKTLMEKLQFAISVVDAAEEKLMTCGLVEKWVFDLKHSVYGLDGLVDEIGYEVELSELQNGSQTSRDKLLNFFSSHNPFNKGVPNLTKMLHKLEGLENVLIETQRVGEEPSWSKIVATESGVYGRDEDMDAVLKLLLSDDDDADADGNKVGLISIVGTGGVGKTTLAQLVYNDSRVQEFFDLKAWVCVSHEFNVFKITEDILEGLCTGCSDDMDLKMLQCKLKEILRGKKCLLVLDDACIEDFKDWNVLLRPFRSGGRGSKIIVTTCSKNVASVMSNGVTYHLGGLSEECCWSLFAEHAFDDGHSNAYPAFEKIGRCIVRKCGGLPLAVKAIGGLLRSRNNVAEWDYILRSKLWDMLDESILVAITLNYGDLPWRLKRCFSYCAIFPKNYAFSKEELVRLWMAEGFLVQPKGNERMEEELGENYFNDLVSRSFFQRSGSSHQSYFVMHDLIHDLAESVSREFCTRLDSEYLSKKTEKIFHLSCMKGDAFKKLRSIHKAPLLRTFLCERKPSRLKNGNDVNKVIYELLPKLKGLRVLSLSRLYYLDNCPSIFNLKHLRYLNLSYASVENLSQISTMHKLQTLILHGCKGLTEIPDSVGHLKHLRYLDLSKTSIKTLPESVGGLSELHYLILYMCEDLRDLPTSLRCLINLQCLDIRGTCLLEMPLQIDNLKNLQILPKFINTGFRIKELEKLHNVRGKLEICNLPNIVDAVDDGKAYLKSKEYLENLELRWKDNADDTWQAEVVLEQLQPHTSLRSLSIVGFGGTRFPNWVGDSVFSNMVSLSLHGCKFCSTLPPLGQLASLKSLIIDNFDRVEVVDTGFYGDAMVPFESLEELRFERMPELGEWISDEVGVFPVLRKLYIKNCPKLTKSFPSDLHSLTTLEIQGCQQLLPSLPRVPLISRLQLKDDSRDLLIHKLHSGRNCLTVERYHALEGMDGLSTTSEELRYRTLDYLLEGMDGLSTTLEEIEIKNCDSLDCFQLELFPNLRSLKIKNCPKLQSLVSLDGDHRNFTSLKSLEIWKCPKLASFPEGRLSAPNLTLFELWDCLNLKLLPKDMHSLFPSLVSLAITDCPQLELFPEGGLPSKLESLQIKRCDKLIAGRRHWDLHKLLSLSHLCFGEYEEIESFPEKEMLLPSTLNSLVIWGVQNLKILNYERLQHLISLRELCVFGCPNLISFPRGGLPHPHLTQLSIKSCSNLKSLPEYLNSLPSLENLAISDCPELESFPEGGLPSNLKSLEISSCEKLIHGRMHWGLQGLSSLSTFEIYKDEDVESFPGQMLLPSSLTSLKICDLYNLKSLDSNGLKNLSFLRELRIWDCPNLQSIPEEGLPTSLSFLSLWDCPLLEKRCQWEIGEDWHKISHIPVIQINWHDISCAEDLF